MRIVLNYRMCAHLNRYNKVVNGVGGTDNSADDGVTCFFLFVQIVYFQFPLWQILLLKCYRRAGADEHGIMGVSRTWMRTAMVSKNFICDMNIFTILVCACVHFVIFLLIAILQIGALPPATTGYTTAPV